MARVQIIVEADNYTRYEVNQDRRHLVEVDEIDNLLDSAVSKIKRAYREPEK